MNLMRHFTLALFLAHFSVGVAGGQGFRFSNPDPAEQADLAAQAARGDRIAYELSTPCRADLKGKKIMVVIGERQSDGYISAQQDNYGPHFQAINARLRSLGLRTFAPEQIRAQIAQAEIDAYFRNNPDAALSAAKRLGASFVLRGLITAEAIPNPIIRVNQVTVSMGFTLAGSNGRIISDVGASSASYSGANIAQMALTLVDEQADEVVAKLYGDYCRNAGLGVPSPKGKAR
ncbi:MAG: hypothetical protein IT521_01730 [Burkholderiales bacterium]|nr:hypothetical protein [Burkholderiales bacterium]